MPRLPLAEGILTVDSVNHSRLMLKMSQTEIINMLQAAIDKAYAHELFQKLVAGFQPLDNPYSMELYTDHNTIWMTWSFLGKLLEVTNPTLQRPRSAMKVIVVRDGKPKMQWCMTLECALVHFEGKPRVAEYHDMMVRMQVWWEQTKRHKRDMETEPREVD